MKELILRKGEEKRIRAGHAWVFSNEVDVVRTPLNAFKPGEQVNVLDSGGRPLGSAYVNPASLIAARFYHKDKDKSLDSELLAQRLRLALDLRQKMFPKPWYRLVHGEADGLPGLVLDRHGDHVVLQVSTAGMEALLDLLLEEVRALLAPKSILLAHDLPGRELEGLSRHSTCLGPVPEVVAIEENNVTYQVPLAGGQKTGWFYDQRANRMALLPFFPGANVLDAFCYAGSFGTLAAKHGATAVSFLDSSALALKWADKNAKINSHDDFPVECLCGDAMILLAEMRRAERKFQVVCLDPPAFIKRRKDGKQGLEAYRRVNELAMDLVEENGVFMTSSCSFHLPATELHRLVSRAALKRGRTLKLLYQGFQGPDHPQHPAMPESAYLKSFLYQVGA